MPHGQAMRGRMGLFTGGAPSVVPLSTSISVSKQTTKLKVHVNCKKKKKKNKDTILFVITVCETVWLLHTLSVCSLVCPAITAYISITLGQILMKLGANVGTYIRMTVIIVFKFHKNLFSDIFFVFLLFAILWQRIF